MKKLFANKFAFFSVLGGVIVVAVVSFVLLSATATTKAVVFNSDMKAGTTITDDMLTEIDVPQDTPGDYFKTKNALIGERITSNVKANQLIYESDLMSSIDVKNNTNEDFLTTAINLPDEQALGGLLTAGDVVDISVIPNDGDVSALAAALPEFNIDTSQDGGIYFVLSNVTLLDTTSSVSSNEGSNMATVTGQDSESGSSSQSSAYYLMSLSYNDYKKLQIAAQYGKVYITLAPKQNLDKAPLLEDMSSAITGGLSDANKESTTKTDSSKKSSNSTENTDTANND